jgi:hypothetical protein
MFNPNPAFLLVQKLKSAPKGFMEHKRLKKKKKKIQSAPKH